MICNGCGAENSDDARFCVKCGRDLSAVVAASGENAGKEDFQAAGYPTSGESSEPDSGSKETLPRPPSAGYQPAISHAQPYYIPYSMPRTDGLCVAGMVLGIIGLVLFWVPVFAIICGILGIVLGSIGIKNVQNEPQLKTGQGMGVAGLVTGILAFLGGIVMFILYASLATW
ncbi:zinc-ribbon domain-containing protein [Candidatus Solincola sp.]|nr:zinc ribbon domain-containing protein [Actinomycetota bacterium]MDI7252633.1 zinc ribbon domain-containing protein [Actinomycetota bacterium]